MPAASAQRILTMLIDHHQSSRDGMLMRFLLDNVGRDRGEKFWLGMRHAIQGGWIYIDDGLVTVASAGSKALASG